MRRKGSVALIIIVVIVILAIAFGSVWLYQVHRSQSTKNTPSLNSSGASSSASTPSSLYPSGWVISPDSIQSPDISFPEFPGYQIYYQVTISNNAGHLVGVGTFQGIPPYSYAQTPNLPVSNSFIANSSEYAEAQQIINILPQHVDFIGVPPDENGQSVLMSESPSITFQYPIQYPSSWASDCQIVDHASLYCELMNQPFDLFNPSSTTPTDYCAFQFTDGGQVSTTTYDTYTDTSDSQVCQKQLDVIGEEFLKDIPTLSEQI